MITTGNAPPVLKPEHQTSAEKEKIQMQKNEENETSNHEETPEQDARREQETPSTGRRFWFTRKRPAASGRSRGNRTR